MRCISLLTLFLISSILLAQKPQLVVPIGHTAKITLAVFSPDGQYILSGSDDKTAILWDLQGRQIQTFRGHTAKITAACFSTDGQFILTGSQDQTVKLWTIQGEELRTFEPEKQYFGAEVQARIEAVAFSPDGQFILGENWGMGEDVLIWDRNGKLIHNVNWNSQNDPAIISPDWTYRLSWDFNEVTSKSNLLRVQNFKGKTIRSLDHGAKVGWGEFSPDGQYILSKGGGYVKVWTLKGKEVLRFEEEVKELQFTPDSRFLLGIQEIGDKHQLTKWDFTGEVRAIFEHQGIPFHEYQLSEDGQYLFGNFGNLGENDVIRGWTLEGDSVFRATRSAKSWGEPFYSPHGQYIISKEKYGHELWVFNIKGEKIATIPQSYQSNVMFSPDGNSFLWFGDDMQLFNLQDSTQSYFQGHTDPLLAGVFLSEGKDLMTMGKNIRSWATVNRETHPLHYRKDHNHAVVLSSEGKRALIQRWTDPLLFWDIPSIEQEVAEDLQAEADRLEQTKEGNASPQEAEAEEWGFDDFGDFGDEFGEDPYVEQTIHEQILSGSIRIPQKELATVKASTFSLDENWIFTGNKAGQIQLWDSLGHERLRYDAHKRRITDVGMSINPQLGISGSYDSTVMIWNLSDSLLQQVLLQKPVREGIFDDFEDVDWGVFGDDFETTDQNVEDSDANPVELRIPEDIELHTLSAPYPVSAVSISSDGQYILTAGPTDMEFYSDSYGDFFSDHEHVDDSSRWHLWQAENGQFRPIKSQEGPGRVFVAQFSPNDQYVYTGGLTQSAIWDKKLNKVWDLTGQTDTIISARFSPNGKYLLTISRDHSGILWEVATGKEAASIYHIDLNDWIVTTPTGLFDASPAAMELMHYVTFVDGKPVVIDLEQLKERYYEPGLLAELLEEESIRSVDAFTNPLLYPEASGVIQNDMLKIQLKERSGGIGKVRIFVNRKSVIEDANPHRQTELSIDLRQFTKYYVPGNNKISFEVYNADEWLRSQEIVLKYRPKTGKKSTTPSLYTIAIGTAEYNGEQLDLTFAGKDAIAMSTALNSTGQELFKERVHSYTLSTEEAENVQPPSKSNIERTFTSIAKQAKAQDIVIVYLSGHGVTYGSSEKAQFYYLTRDIASEDLSDTEIRNQYAISDEELSTWMNEIAALKQVMIIDACNSGKVVENILAVKKKLNPTQVRALDRMKDRTGMYVLSGSAADKVSYEASQYGQGLLTYSLLSGMNGRATHDDGRIDIMSLFQFSRDEVPSLAKSINGIQTPMMAFPKGGESFDIGIKTSETDIPIAQTKPVFVRSQFQNAMTFDDDLELGEQFNQHLNAMTNKGADARLVYVPSTRFNAQSYSVKGQYTRDGDTIDLKANLFQGKTIVHPIQLSGQASDLEGLVRDIMKEVRKQLK